MSEDFYNEYIERNKPRRFTLPLIKLTHRRMLKNAKKLGFKGPEMLEIGYGLGFFAEVAKENGYSYSIVDGSSSLISLAQKNGYGAYLGFVPPMPATVPQNFYDCVWVSHVLEHARDWGHAKEMLTEILKVLKPGGKICIICPDITSWKNEFWDIDWSHGYPTTTHRVNQLLAEAGYSSIVSAPHTCMVSTPLFRWLLDVFFYIMPWRTMDLFFKPIFGRPLAKGFMFLLGFRQVMCVAQK